MRPSIVLSDTLAIGDASHAFQFRRAREALTPSARANFKGRGGNHGPLM